MNILVTGAWQDATNNINKIEDLGHEIIFMQQEKDDLPCAPEWVEGIICNGFFLHHNIEQFQNLRYIQLTSAGYDRVPMEYVKKHKIQIYNARGVYSIPMAEFVLSSVLQIYKQHALFRANQAAHQWAKCRTVEELNGKQVLIVGCGNVGTECAKRFTAFGCDVYGVDLNPEEKSYFHEIFSLDQIITQLNRADIVVLTLPLTESTYHFMDSTKIEHMKDKSVLVNIARGAVVDEAAILKMSKKFAGVVLDVFEEEPIQSDSPFWESENVFITPHNSFVGNGNNDRLRDVIIKNLENEVKK